MADDDDFQQSISDGGTDAAVDSADGDSVTETTETSWFSRLGRALVGVLIGIVLIVGGVTLLAWNEGRSVTAARSLTEGRGAAIDVDAAMPVAANEGRLVHVVGLAATGSDLTDPDFGVAAKALVIVRKVEMFQWEQHEETTTQKQVGGGEAKTKTYSYAKIWSARPIDSSGFRQPLNHSNPPFALPERTFAAKDATLGGFALREALLSSLAAIVPMAVDASVLPKIQAKLGRPATQIDNAVFVGVNAALPQIGDLRLSYTMAPVGNVTVVARQSGSGFAGYQTKAGDVIDTIRTGRLSIGEVFADLEQENAILTWLIRGGGTLATLVGFVLILAPLSVFADFLPILGSIVGFGAFLMALSLTLVVAPLVIAIAWFAFRPLLAVTILVVGVVIAGALRWLASSRRRIAAPVGPPPAQART
ncbi:MAG: TMEM43 family protein [Ancalomicrobiaceae bacterium]|nr:TMEM43 family protein [Ancalomicrobiaceae bacterium]